MLLRCCRENMLPLPGNCRFCSCTIEMAPPHPAGFRAVWLPSVSGSAIVVNRKGLISTFLDFCASFLHARWLAPPRLSLTTPHQAVLDFSHTIVRYGHTADSRSISAGVGIAGFPNVTAPRPCCAPTTCMPGVRKRWRRYWAITGATLTRPRSPARTIVACGRPAEPARS